MATVRTWVLIADAGRARVFETRGPGTGLEAIEELTLTNETPASRDLGRDRPARTFDSEGHGRHAIEPKSDPHREQKRDFARHLADELEAAHRRKAFEKLVIVAPPAFLGDLRSAVDAGVHSCITAEIAKDLTRTPTVELPAHLSDAIRL